MAQYNLKVKTKPVYLDESRTLIGELLNARIQCEFDDDGSSGNDYDVTIYADDKRYNVSSDITDSSSELIVTNLSSIGYPYFRHYIDVVAREGLWSSFFMLELDKKVPTDGNFKYYGFEFNVIPHADIDAEFYHPTGAINNGWT